MYPRMIQDALYEGRQDAADSFAMALERERHHLEVFNQALEKLKARQSRVAATQVAITQEPTIQGSRATADTPPVVDQFIGDEEAIPNLETYVAAVQEVDRERFRVANLADSARWSLTPRMGCSAR